MKYRLIQDDGPYKGKVVAIVETPTLIDGQLPDETPVTLTPIGLEILGIDPKDANHKRILRHRVDTTQ